MQCPKNALCGCGQLYNAVVEIMREAQISFYIATDSNSRNVAAQSLLLTRIRIVAFRANKELEGEKLASFLFPFY